jgi:hypothetical protein
MEATMNIHRLDDLFRSEYRAILAQEPVDILVDDEIEVEMQMLDSVYVTCTVEVLS